MKTIPPICPEPETGRKYWRSLEQLGDKPEFREWLINFGDSGYVALYCFDGNTAVIVAVRHQREVGY